jgi:hypothetical protein
MTSPARSWSNFLNALACGRHHFDAGAILAFRFGHRLKAALLLR